TLPNDRPWPSSTRDGRNSPTTLRDNDASRGTVRQRQTPAQSTWWAAQPHQARPADPEQSRHNREVSTRGGGKWNANVESSHHNSMPIHTPEHVHSAPIESHQSHSAPAESHSSYSPPPVDHS